MCVHSVGACTHMCRDRRREWESSTINYCPKLKTLPGVHNHAMQCYKLMRIKEGLVHTTAWIELTNKTLKGRNPDSKGYILCDSI